MSEKQPRKRDRALTFWLILILTGNAIYIVSQIYPDIDFLFFPLGAIFFTVINSFSTGFPLWSIPLFIAYSVGSVCSIIILFMWRKIGFYAICLFAVVGFITSLASGVLTLSIIINFVSIGILGILLRSEWKLFR